MRKLILAGIVSISANGLAQDVYEKMAQETCTCIQTKRPNLEITAVEDLKADYLTCFLQSYSAHVEEINKMENVNLQDKVSMEQFGEQVAMKMLTHCPNYLIALGTAFEAEDQSIESEVAYTTIEGEISDIKSDQFVTIVLKDASSRTHNLMLMDYFESAGLYTDNKIKKKDRISATYSEIEMYDPKMKEFRYFKVISALEKK